MSELIKKSWIPQTVQENGAVVYTKGAASNTRAGYTNFQLSLSGASTATLTELDSNTFTGTYEFQGDTKLILKNLNPQPSGSGGTIEYSITKSTATNLDLNRTATSLKTGGSTNGYALVMKRGGRGKGGRETGGRFFFIEITLFCVASNLDE